MAPCYPAIQYCLTHLNGLKLRDEEDRVVWYVVAVWILLAIGATLILGALAWCFMHARTGLYAIFQYKTGYFKVGCN